MRYLIIVMVFVCMTTLTIYTIYILICGSEKPSANESHYFDIFNSDQMQTPNEKVKFFWGTILYIAHVCRDAFAEEIFLWNIFFISFFLAFVCNILWILKCNDSLTYAARGINASDFVHPIVIAQNKHKLK